MLPRLHWIVAIITVVSLSALTARAAMVPTNLNLHAEVTILDSMDGELASDLPSDQSVTNPTGAHGHEASISAMFVGDATITLSAAFQSDKFNLDFGGTATAGILADHIDTNGIMGVTFNLTSPATLHWVYSWSGQGDASASAALRQNGPAGTVLWSSNSNPWSTDLALGAGTYYANYTAILNTTGDSSGYGGLSVLALVPEPTSLGLLSLPLVLALRRRNA